MKKILYIILAVLCHAAFISCWEIEDVDFPKRVRIPQKGGVVTIETESHIYGLSLKGRDDFDIAFDDRTGEMARDSDSITLRWLTLIHTKKGIHRCYFKASENNTGKKTWIYTFGNGVQYTFRCDYRAGQIITFDRP